ncbi:MAG: aspartyl-tRNA(Asn)/glutamyl-tRNA (Gln) amidotransferase subunit A, partial [bacterium]
MADNNIPFTATAIAKGVKAGDFTAEEVAKATIARIEALEPKIDAFLHLLPEQALAAARALDAATARGEEPGPMAGVPVGLKDNMCLAGAPCSCASKILAGYLAPYDATVVERLAGAGSFFPGKANLDEFAMGSSTENSAYKPTKNPWDAARVPGGSSGGSAAAVASRMVPVSLGSDTGGS